MPYILITILFVVLAWVLIAREQIRHKKTMRAIMWRQAEDAWHTYCQNPTVANCANYRDMLKRYVSYVENVEL